MINFNIMVYFLTDFKIMVYFLTSVLLRLWYIFFDCCILSLGCILQLAYFKIMDILCSVYLLPGIFLGYGVFIDYCILTLW